MSTVIIHLSGTLGDNLPMLALAKGIRNAGARVVVVLNPAMLAFAERLGLETACLTDVERGPSEARENAWSWDHWSGNPADNPKAKPFDLDLYVLQASELVDMCRQGDLLLTTSLRSLGFVAATALDMPFVTASVMPYNFWRPGPVEGMAMLHADLQEYEMQRAVIGQTFRRLGVARDFPSFSRGYLWSRDILLAASPHFSRPDFRPLAAAHQVDMTGFLYFEDPAWDGWQPDDELRAFFDRPEGMRPLVFGLSSVPVERPADMLRRVALAAALLGRPLLVQSGWAGFSSEHLPPDVDPDMVIFRDFMSQDWLFAHAACAVQHGGVGSLARALRRDCPVLVLPLGNDQLYNATRVHDLGVGAAAHPFAATPESLAALLRDTVLAPRTKGRAARLGALLRAERGLETTVAYVMARLEHCRSKTRTVSDRKTPDRPHAPPGAGPGCGEPLSIPHLLHQIWNDDHVPKNMRRMCESWKKMHSDWEYRLWTHEEAREFLVRHYAWFVHVYDSYPMVINRADAVRYFILHHYGGVYVDLDFECLRDMGPFVAGSDLVFGLEPLEHIRRQSRPDRPVKRIVCNAWMASGPGHPFWEHLFRQLLISHERPCPLDATGAFLLTRAVETYEGERPARLLPPERLYPIHDEELFENLDPERRAIIASRAFAVHHWHGGWWRGREALPSEKAMVDVCLNGSPTLTTPVEIQSMAGLARGAPCPKISCLLVTGGKNGAARNGLTRRSVRQFLLQDYPERELVVVDDGPDSGLGTFLNGIGDSRIVYVRLPYTGKSLGELRNLAVAQAGGELVAQWDDDDLHDPSRLSVQYGVLRLFGVEACFLRRESIWWPGQRRLAVSCPKVWESSILCLRDRLPAYPELAKGEDTPVVQTVWEGGRVALLDAPWLYVYVCHGRNTWDAGHFDMWWETASQRIVGRVYEEIVRMMLDRLGVDDAEGA